MMNKFGFLSLGLIGGSIALALRQICPDAHITAYARRQSTLDEALSAGAIDIGTTTINDLFSDCDLIFLCAPVAVNNQFLEQLKPILSDKTILTDVGSVKGPIHETISRLGLDSRFIGGHPMAGSEKTGFANANPVLLENAYYILTPTETVAKEAVAAYSSLVKSMGAIPIQLSAQEHDYVTAAISHVPHLVAAALANLVHDHDSAQETMKMIAAGGFKDITRIASSSPDMWESICMSNTENIANLLDDYIVSLQTISSAVRANNTVSPMICSLPPKNTGTPSLICKEVLSPRYLPVMWTFLMKPARLHPLPHCLPKPGSRSKISASYITAILRRACCGLSFMNRRR